jgi:hypothetical protein
MEADPSLMLHDSAGEVIRIGGGQKTSDVFDFSNPKARALCPRRPGAVKRPKRFPYQIDFVWGFCMGAQGA